MIKLKELHLENFRSWENLHLTNLDQKGLCLINGINGSGKSSVRQALEYLLLDTISDEIPVREIPRNGNTECKISCKLEKDGDEIEIIRYRNHKKKGNNKYLIVNGNQFPDESVKEGNLSEVQKRIEQVLGIDKYSLFVSTIFSSNSPSFPALPESSRKDILYDTLDLHKYNKYYERAKTKRLEIEKEIDKYKNKIIIIDNSIRDKKDQLKDFKNKIKKWESKNENDIKGLKGRLLDLKVLDTEPYDKKIKRLKERFFTVDNEKISILEEKRARINNKVIELKQELMNLRKTVEDIENGTNQCPLLEKECKELEEHNNELYNKYKPQLDRLELSYENERRKLNEIVEGLATLNSQVEKNSELTSKMEKLEQQKREIELNNSNIEDRKQDLINRINEIEKEENPYLSLMKNTAVKLIEDESTRKEYLDKIKNLEDEIQYYKYWETGFSKKGIPNLKAENFLIEVENRTNKILSMLDKNLYVKIDSQSKLQSGDIREKISYKVFSPDRPNITDFKSYSAGQRQRIKIADIFAFNELISNFNFMILDEILELSLDESGKEDVMTFLRSMTSKLDSIFVISHSQQIKDKFDSIIDIEMRGGISKIVV